MTECKKLHLDFKHPTGFTEAKYWIKVLLEPAN